MSVHRVAVGAPEAVPWGAYQELLLPAVLLRDLPPDVASFAHVYRASGPTVAFSARDTRSGGFREAVRIARAAGFACVTRSPGGRMVAYDRGAVIVDEITRLDGVLGSDSRRFDRAATRHLSVLRALTHADLRIGPVEDEYCPGQFSINVAGESKIAGSAQRIAARAALFSTVVQVELSDRARHVLFAASAALGYPLREASVAGLRDFDRHLGADQVVEAFALDLAMEGAARGGDVPTGALAHVATLSGIDPQASFGVDQWARAHPIPRARGEITGR